MLTSVVGTNDFNLRLVEHFVFMPKSRWRTSGTQANTMHTASSTGTTNISALNGKKVISLSTSQQLRPPHHSLSSPADCWTWANTVVDHPTRRWVSRMGDSDAGTSGSSSSSSSPEFALFFPKFTEALNVPTALLHLVDDPARLVSTIAITPVIGLSILGLGL